MILDLIKIGIEGVKAIFLKKEEGKISEIEANQQLAEIQSKLQSEVQAAVVKELEAKERIIVAELQQGDLFTKRARPTIVYAGLLFAVVDAIFKAVAVFGGVPEGIEVPTSFMPAQFWLAWGGVCSIYVVGRTAEKRQSTNKVMKAVSNVASMIP